MIKVRHCLTIELLGIGVLFAASADGGWPPALNNMEEEKVSNTRSMYCIGRCKKHPRRCLIVYSTGVRCTPFRHSSWHVQCILN